MGTAQPATSCASEAKRTEAKQAAISAAARISARLKEQNCVVCLSPCPGLKACKCSYMHAQCAQDYVDKLSATCRVCSCPIEPVRLSKRPHDDDPELEVRAFKKMREKKEKEKAESLVWARTVAPAAAHIMWRHFRHSRPPSEGGQQNTDLSFSTIVMSIIYSEDAYVEDLSEWLNGRIPSAEVEQHVKRLNVIGESLTSPEGVDDTIADVRARRSLHLLTTRGLAATSHHSFLSWRAPLAS